MTSLDGFCIQSGAWAELKHKALPLRIAVFVREQGVPIELEEDEFDDKAMHVLVTRQAAAVATGRILPDGRLGRLAVHQQFRGQGLGRIVFQRLLDYAQSAGIESLHLHARYDAKSFYEPFGFRVQGKRFMEAGSWHVVMTRSGCA